MTAKRFHLSTTDPRLTSLDAAVARLDDRLASEPPGEQAPTPADEFAAFEEALDRIDRQLDRAVDAVVDSARSLGPALEPVTAHDESIIQATAATELPQASRASLALVVSSPPMGGETAAASAVVVAEEVESLWEKPDEGVTVLERLLGTTQNLLWLRRAIDSRSERVAQHMRWNGVTDVLHDAVDLCAELDLPTARVRAQFALAAFESDRLDLLAREVRELVRHIHHDLHSCAMLPVPPRRTWALSLSLAEHAHQAFPSAAADIADAGRCIAFDRHTAATFHLLRAAERGRIALARAIRIDGRTQPAAHWSATIVALQKRSSALSRWPAGPARKAAKDFLTVMLSDARGLEDIRRRIDEGETFEECHSMATWVATRDFLAAAAERVSEARDTLLSADDFIGGSSQ